jgi:hypothetical protein
MHSKNYILNQLKKNMTHSFPRASENTVRQSQ